jgi:hypothetical protein
MANQSINPAQGQCICDAFVMLGSNPQNQNQIYSQNTAGFTGTIHGNTDCYLQFSIPLLHARERVGPLLFAVPVPVVPEGAREVLWRVGGHGTRWGCSHAAGVAVVRVFGGAGLAGLAGSGHCWCVISGRHTSLSSAGRSVRGALSRAVHEGAHATPRRPERSGENGFRDAGTRDTE